MHEAERQAEIALRDVAQIGEELHGQRLIQAILGAQARRHHQIGRVVGQHDRDRVARQRANGGEGHNDGGHQDRNQPRQTARDEAQHRA
jgi:hypothetical protein